MPSGQTFGLTRRTFLAGLGWLSRYEIPKQPDRISAQRAGDRDKLDDVDAPLATFVLGNKGLRPAEFLGQRALADARSTSRRDQDFDQSRVFRGFEGLLHVPPGLRIGGTQFDPRIELSQKRILLTVMCCYWPKGPLSAGSLESGERWLNARKAVDERGKRMNAPLLQASMVASRRSKQSVPGPAAVGQKKRKKYGVPTGNAGEYFVMGELLRREFDAQLADRNTKGYDVLVGRPDDKALQKIQVKSVVTEPWYVRRSSFADPLIDQITIYVLIGKADGSSRVRYFIARNRDLAEQVSVPPAWKDKDTGFMSLKSLRPFEDQWTALSPATAAVNNADLIGKTRKTV